MRIISREKITFREIIIEGIKKFAGEIVGVLFLVVFLYFFPSLRSMFTDYSISPKNEREPDSAVQRELESHQREEERLKAELERHKEALRKAEAKKAEEARQRAEAERQRTTQPNSQRANVRDFGKFTINVADGWTAVDDERTIVITKNDNTAQLTISIADAGGATKAQLAEAFVAEFKKSFAEVGTPVADSDGDYSWDMKTTAGAELHAMLGLEGSDFILCVVTNRQAAPDDISAMVDSIHKK